LTICLQLKHQSDISTEVYKKRNVEDVIALDAEQWYTNPFRKLYTIDSLMGFNFHSLQIKDKSKFVTAMGFRISDHPKVLSVHHQAVDLRGKDLTVAAASRDGNIIEAAEHKRYPNVLAVQLHPEFPMLWDTEPRFRRKPDGPLTSLNAVLAAAPPSTEFNKAIWKWFSTKLIEGHVKQNAPSINSQARYIINTPAEILENRGACAKVRILEGRD
jgi:putative glutamine amidotransferase